MNPLSIIEKYYKKDDILYTVLVTHSLSVANKALDIANNHPEFTLDKEFLYEAAMLHDIGVFLTNAPEIYCVGQYHYLRHGQLGAELIRNEGLPKHALVCERHTGVGISKEDIIINNLPIPLGDYLPITMEEKVICFADKFFSKKKLDEERTAASARKSIAKFGEQQANTFDTWCNLFL